MNLERFRTREFKVVMAYMVSLIFIFLFLLFLQRIFITYVYLLDWFLMASAPTINFFGKTLSFEYFGFWFPLVVSLTLIIVPLLAKYPFVSELNKVKLKYNLGAKRLVILLIVVTILSFIPSFSKGLASGGGGAYPILFLLVMYSIAMLLSRIDIKVAIPIGYALGFYEGFISDLATTLYSTAQYHWAGGLAFLDGDFLIPLINVIAIYLIYKYIK